jgi:cleavage and polyadenylation specificity factor subunit 1
LTNYNFLIDTGADVSVIPPQRHDTPVTSATKLYAANGTPIKTYGTKDLSVSLGLRREFRWCFIVADVGYPIIGANFLEKHGILPDMKEKRLIDDATSLSVNGRVQSVHYTSISTLDHQSEFAKILQQYPAVTQTNIRRECKVLHNTEHVIETTGPPTAARARRLPPDKLKAAKAEFQKRLEHGDIRPSKSPWATPITVARKKGPERWRICGDFRALNRATKPDRYPVPNILDFNNHLAGAMLFTALDVKRAYHQIPVAKDDIEKTAMITPFGLFEWVVMPFGLRNAAQSF